MLFWNSIPLQRIVCNAGGNYRLQNYVLSFSLFLNCATGVTLGFEFFVLIYLADKPIMVNSAPFGLPRFSFSGGILILPNSVHFVFPSPGSVGSWDDNLKYCFHLQNDIIFFPVLLYSILLLLLFPLVQINHLCRHIFAMFSKTQNSFKYSMSFFKNLHSSLTC